MGADIGYEGATAALPWSSLPWTGSTLPVALAGSASATRRPASASTLWRAPCARSSIAPARAATSPASAFSVAAIRVVSAGRDVGHVVAVQVLRTAIHVIICGLLIGFRLCGRLATGFRRRLGDPKSGCQIGNAGDPVLPQEIERRWIDASLLCQLIDDRRLELDLGQQEGVWLPIPGCRRSPAEADGVPRSHRAPKPPRSGVEQRPTGTRPCSCRSESICRSPRRSPGHAVPRGRPGSPIADAPFQHVARREASAAVRSACRIPAAASRRPGR